MIPLSANVASLRPYQSARSLRKGEGWIFMDANESPLCCATTFGELPALNRYPDPTSDALRDAVSTFYGVERQNLIMASGSDELIDLAVRCFVRGGRKVAALSPSYGMYRVSADANGAAFTTARLAADFSPDADAILAVLDDADLLFLCSPNNPTATIIEPGLIERLLATFPGLVVIDEAYGEFADVEGIPSSIDLVKRGAENLLVLRTFSKAFGAAGIRLGYGVACQPVIDVLLRIKPPYNVSVLAQTAGLAIWSQRDVMEENVRRLIAERARLMRGCERLGCVVFPSKANFFLLRPPQGVSAKRIYQDLIDKHRLVIRQFGETPGLDNLLRISVGTPGHNDLLFSSLSELLP